MIKRTTVAEIFLNAPALGLLLSLELDLDLFVVLGLFTIIGPVHNHVVRPGLHANPAELQFTNRAAHMITAEVFLHIGLAFWAAFTLADVVISFFLCRVLIALILQFFVVVGHLRALGWKVRLLIAHQTHL